MNRYWRLFEDAVENDPEEVAIDEGLPLRFIDLRNAAVRLSRAWANSGLKVGHTIAVIDSLNARTAIALFASWRLGIRPLMVPPWMTIGEAEDLRDRIGAQAIWDSFSGVFIGGCLVYQTSRIVNADMYFVTSGTTGAPKIVAHSNESLLAGLAAAMSYQKREPGASAPDFCHTASPYKFRLGFRHFCTMPISTIAGFTNLQRAVLSGDTLVLCHSSRSEEILQRLRET